MQKTRKDHSRFQNAFESMNADLKSLGFSYESCVGAHTEQLPVAS